MITSDRQLAVTTQKIKELRDSLKEMEEASAKPFQKASAVQLKALIQELELEVKEYQLFETKNK